KKNNIIIGSLCAVVLLMAVGYAAFSSILNIKGTSSISSNWNILITNVESKNIVGAATNAEDPSWEALTATFKTNLVSPGDSIEYDITIENRGNLNAVLEKITLTDSNNPAIKFTSSGLEEGSELNAGSSAILTVKVEYDNNVTSQPESTEGTFTVTLDYSQKDGISSDAPTGGNTINVKGVDVELATEGDGLYADEYEIGRYIYKGTNPDNYITFNGETWRILSVENDGTLKIMKATSIGNIPFDKTGGTYGSNNWTRPADLNTYLNNDYYNTLSSETQNLIKTHTWGVGSVTVKNNDLGGQIQSENGTAWNGNIGLMTVSEFLRANTNTSQCGSYSLNNTNYNTCKTTNYIVTLVPSKSYIWTISPTAGDSNHVFSALFNGCVSDRFAKLDDYGVLPVLYLTSDIHLDGEGTSTNPYRVVS
ncbi:MAG: hypothetical protein HFH46_02895, partial [Bacilli bacterium]|nr:hypothetical protein [Bacilli bacterium]